MNLKELREIISGSEIAEELNKYTVSITFPSNGEKYDFIGFINVYKFLKEQKDKWGAVEKGKMNHNFNHSKAFFDNATSQFISIVNNIKNKNLNKANLVQALRNIKTPLTQTTKFLYLRRQKFTFYLACKINILTPLHRHSNTLQVEL